MASHEPRPASPALLASRLLTRRRLGRIEGAALIGLYLAYIAIAVRISPDRGVCKHSLGQHAAA
jgi:hypothetical protein